MNNLQQVTIYSSSEFMGNIVKFEGKLIDFGTRKYAQYNSAPFVQFIPARKRNVREIQKSSSPMIVILAGIGHPDPEGVFTEARPGVTAGVTIAQSKYSSCDDRWDTDFDTMIDKYISEIEGVKVIADYRHTKGFNSYGQAKPVEKREGYDEWVAKLKLAGVTDQEITDLNKQNY